jgi:hypothetical protein
VVGFDSLGGAAGCCVGVVSARADLFDVLTIHGPTPVFATTAGIHLTVEGETSDFSFAEAYISLLDGGLLTGPPSLLKVQCKGLFGSCTDGTEGPFAFDMLMNVRVSSADPSFPIRVGILAGASNNGTSDILGSGQLAIVLPPGFTFTSASGVLLSGPSPAPVPEPASALLVAVGMAAMAIRRRRVGAAVHVRRNHEVIRCTSQMN